MRALYPSAAFLALHFLLPDSARACSCMPDFKTYAERRLIYGVVFHGKVTANQADTAQKLRQIRFQVIKDYSVDGSFVGDTATIWTSIYNSACGIDIPVDQEALILSDTAIKMTGMPKGDLATSSCIPNFWGNDLPSILSQLDEAVGVRARSPRAAARVNRAVVDCGQILFEGKVQANGAQRRAAGNR